MSGCSKNGFGWVLIVDRFLVLERVVVYENHSVWTTRIGNLEFWENGGANGILN